jgi:hypothetical protein
MACTLSTYVLILSVQTRTHTCVVYTGHGTGEGSRIDSLYTRHAFYSILQELRPRQFLFPSSRKYRILVACYSTWFHYDPSIVLLQVTKHLIRSQWPSAFIIADGPAYTNTNCPSLKIWICSVELQKMTSI